MPRWVRSLPPLLFLAAFAVAAPPTAAAPCGDPENCTVRVAAARGAAGHDAGKVLSGQPGGAALHPNIAAEGKGAATVSDTRLFTTSANLAAEAALARGEGKDMRKLKKKEKATDVKFHGGSVQLGGLERRLKAVADRFPARPLHPSPDPSALRTLTRLPRELPQETRLDLSKNLLEAAEKNQFEETLSLLIQGADINYKDSQGYAALHWAAWNDNADAIRLLIVRGATLNIRNMLGNTPLHWAAWNGRAGAVQLLIAKGADVNARNNDGETPLHSAAKRRGVTSLSAIRTLLSLGADPSIRNNKGDTAHDYATDDAIRALLPRVGNDEQTVMSEQLFEAAKSGKVDEMQHLLSLGADVEYRDKYRSTALHQAGQKGHVEAVRLLLDRGANVNAQDTWTRTPLLYSAWENQEEVVKMLLAAGADPSIRDSDKKTARDHTTSNAIRDLLSSSVASVTTVAPTTSTLTSEERTALSEKLFEVAKSGKVDEIRKLLSEGADVQYRDKFQSTALHQAGFKGHVEAVQLLLDHGAEVNAKDVWTRTPLLYSAWENQEKVVKMLLAAGADASIKDYEGKTARDHTTSEAVRNLLSSAADPGTSASNADQTALSEKLFEAAKSGRVDDMRQLLSQGADAKYRDKYRSTALHQAGLKGHVVAVQLLLDHGAEVNAKDVWTRTPLLYSAWENQEKVVKMLLAAGADASIRDYEGKTARDHATRDAVIDLFPPPPAADFPSPAPPTSTLTDEKRTALSEELFEAAKSGRVDEMQLLLSLGADVLYRDKHRSTALHQAGNKGHVEAVRLLLDRGAEVNAKDAWTRTPLLYSAWQNQEKVVKMLLAAGADASIKDYEQKTARDHTTSDAVRALLAQ